MSPVVLAGRPAQKTDVQAECTACRSMAQDDAIGQWYGRIGLFHNPDQLSGGLCRCTRDFARSAAFPSTAGHNISDKSAFGLVRFGSRRSTRSMYECSISRALAINVDMISLRGNR